MGFSQLVWFGVVALVTLTSAQLQMCPVDQGAPACGSCDGAGVCDALVTITITATGNTCQESGKDEVECSTLDTKYDGISSIVDESFCNDICKKIGTNAGNDELCGAYTYKKSAGPIKEDKCYFLQTCTQATDPDESPCFVNDHCFSGVTCDSPPPPAADCKTPIGVDHDYSRPQNLHWSRPCVLATGGLDNDCDVYIDSQDCKDGTVCTLDSCNNVAETHTCANGNWLKKDGTGGTTEVAEDDWKDRSCDPCDEKTVLPEPGLSLHCLDAKEPVYNSVENKYTFKKGPCYLYCDGIFVQSAHCNLDTAEWEDDKGDDISGELYCWTPPPGQV